MSILRKIKIGNIIHDIGIVWGKISGSITDQTDLANALNDKVDKVSGKGLSTEDYTTAEKTKLSGIEAQANKTTDATVGGWGYIKSSALPLSDNIEWGKEKHAGSVTPDITLPNVPASPTAVLELGYTFTALSANADFTPPSDYILGDEDGFADMEAGDTLAYTDLTIGSIYECSFKVIDGTHIALLMKEYATQ